VPVSARRLPPLALVVIALGVVILAACSRVVGPREWTALADLVAGGTFAVTVRDETGSIDNVEIDPVGVAAVAPTANPPGQPNVLLVAWTGGACDRRTDIAVRGAAPALTLTIATTVAPGECDAIGVEHTVRLTSSQPLPAAGVTVRTGPSLGG
jgi:hypothetical protein